MTQATTQERHIDVDGDQNDALHLPVPPYTYNPSAWSQRIPIALIALVAAAISAHLSLYQWGLIENAWDPVFGQASNRVLKSDEAEAMFAFLGIHDASLGVLAYLGDAILGLAGSTRRWQFRPWLVILFGIDIIPVGIVSVILVVLQAFVVGDWCFLCLVTAVLSLTLVYWAWDEVRITMTYLYVIWKQNRSARLVWNPTWGYYDEKFEKAADTMLVRKVT